MNIKKIIAQGLLKIADELLEAFDMTREEWKRYKSQHPGANIHNHHIIDSPLKKLII